MGCALESLDLQHSRMLSSGGAGHNLLGTVPRENLNTASFRCDTWDHNGLLSLSQRALYSYFDLKDVIQKKKKKIKTRRFFPREAWDMKAKIRSSRDFPGGPVVKTSRCQCRGQGFDPQLEN